MTPLLTSAGLPSLRQRRLRQLAVDLGANRSDVYPDAFGVDAIRIVSFASARAVASLPLRSVDDIRAVLGY